MQSAPESHEQRSPNAGLVASDITVRRSGRTILDRVSFTLDRGEIVAVIGANGAGKTTLLESVVGAARADSGRVTYQSHVLRSLRARARVFSFMPDAAEPPTEVRVTALIEYARRFGRVPEPHALQLAERIGLCSLGSARAGALSRGEKRRVSLFGALCTDRPVVVLDEPLGSFDPLQLLDVLQLLRECARAGTALLLSVHQLSDAEKIADRILMLDRGRVAASGSLAELCTQVACPSGSLEQVFLRVLEQRHARA
jgi:ABC-2 type transport system ATP-binding protein